MTLTEMAATTRCVLLSVFIFSLSAFLPVSSSLASSSLSGLDTRIGGTSLDSVSYSGQGLLNYSLAPNSAKWDKTIIIVTGGRMGSTLVSGLVSCGIEPGCAEQQRPGGQRKMVANPDVFMAGENNLALWYLFDFEQQLKKGWKSHQMNDRNNRGGVSNPWYHTPDPAGLRQQIQMLVQSYFLQEMTHARIVGFKEVRWYQKSETRPTKKNPQTVHSAADLTSFIQWLHSYVPNLYVVFNLRNPVDTSHSGWWAGQPGSLNVLKDLHREITEVYENLQKMEKLALSAPKSFMLDYDRDILTQNVSRLYDWLGEKFNRDLVGSVFQASFSSSSHHTKYSDISVHPTRT